MILYLAVIREEETTIFLCLNEAQAKKACLEDAEDSISSAYYRIDTDAIPPGIKSFQTIESVFGNEDGELYGELDPKNNSPEPPNPPEPPDSIF